MAQEIKQQISTLRNQPLSKIYRGINSIVSTLHASGSNIENVQTLVDSLSYADGIERLLKLHLIDVFKLIQYVVPIFVSDDMHLIKVALKFHWFFEGTDTSVVNAQYFVSNVFPHTSVVVRRKIVNQLSLFLKDEEQSQAFFMAVREKYGTSQALCMLPACGLGFFQSFLDSSHLDLPPHIMFKVLRKHPSLVIAQLEKEVRKPVDNWLKSRRLTKYRKVLQELAENHTDLFFNFYEKYKNFISVDIGRRSASRFIKKNKIAIIRSPEHFVGILQKRKLYKNFSFDEFQEFFTGLYPKKFSDLQDGLESHVSGLFLLLKNMKYEEKRSVIFNSFYNIYGKHLLDYPKLITENFLRFLTTEERIQVAEAKVKLCKGDDQSEEYKWICYYETVRSLPMIKKLLMEAPDVKTRENLVPLLVRTCSVNDDSEALKGVCEYFTSRFRNDDVSVRAAFLRRLLQDYSVQKLSEQHWKSINELLQIFIFNNEYTKVNDLIVQLLEESITYSISEKGSVPPNLLQQFIKTFEFRTDKHASWQFFTQFSHFDRSVIVKFFHVWFHDNLFPKKHINGVTVFLVKLLSKWNTEHKSEELSVLEFPVLANWVNNAATKGDETLLMTLISEIEDDRQMRHNLFSELMKCKPESKVVVYYMRHDYVYLLSQSDLFIRYMIETKPVKDYKNFLRKVKSFKFAGIFDGIVTRCRGKVEDSGENRGKCKAAEFLSLLVNASEFYSVVNQFYPRQEKVDFFSDDSQDLFDMQKTIARCLGNVKPINDFSILLPFCMGDYLKLVLKSLNDICLNTPESRIIQFLDVLSQKPVSVLKHSVRYSCKVLSCDVAYSRLSSVWQRTQHPSIRRVILDQLFRIFYEDPSDLTWQLLKSCVSSLTAEDKKSLELFTSFDKIPDAYKSDFFLVCWTTMIKIESEGKKVFSPRPALLKLITKEMYLSIPESFFQDLLSEHLFAVDSLFKHTINMVCARFLLYSPSNEIFDSRLAKIMDLFKRFTQSSWNTFDASAVNPYASRMVASRFVQAYCEEALKVENSSFEMKFAVSKFLEYWKQALTPEIALADYLILEFSHMYRNMDGDKSRIDFAPNLLCFLEQIVSKYGLGIVPLIMKKLNNFSSNFARNTDNDGNELDRLAEFVLSKELSVCVMIILNMFTNYSYNNENKEKFRNMLDPLTERAKKCESVVQFMLQNWIADLSRH